MEVTNRIAYDVEKSAERIDDILSAGNGNYEDKGYVPSRSNLTYAGNTAAVRSDDEIISYSCLA